MTTSTVVSGALWVVALWRLPSIRHSRKQRSLALTLAALALAMTFEVPQVRDAVNAAVGADVRLSPLLKHLLGVTSAACLLDFVVAVVRPQGLARRIRWAALGVTLPLMTGFYAMANWPSAEVSEGWRPVFPVLYTAVFILYIGISMVAASWLFLGGVRHSRRFLGKVGLGLLGAGTLLGSLYAAQRVAFVFIRLVTGRQYPDLENIVSTMLKQWSILAIALGVCLPPLSVAVDYLRAWRALRQIRPLWVQLTDAAPHVVLSAMIRRTRVPLRLERCVIEIEDACLALREYVSVDVRDRARALAHLEAVPPNEIDEVTEACWLRVAVDRTRGGQRLEGVDHPALGVTGRDRQSELDWLQAVSRAYVSSPAVRKFLRQEKSVDCSVVSGPERVSSHDHN
ncbi:MAB_1171c family putative transporter [Streptomyces griseoviridis]